MARLCSLTGANSFGWPPPAPPLLPVIAAFPPLRLDPRPSDPFDPLDPFDSLEFVDPLLLVVVVSAIVLSLGILNFWKLKPLRAALLLSTVFSLDVG